MGQVADAQVASRILYVGLGTAGVHHIEGKLPEAVQVKTS